MDVKLAVRKAKESVQELFGEQIVSDPVLEELEYDDEGKFWRITLGFFRVADYPKPLQGRMADVQALVGGVRRSFKVFKIDDTTEKVVSVKDRELP